MNEPRVWMERWGWRCNQRKSETSILTQREPRRTCPYKLIKVFLIARKAPSFAQTPATNLGACVFEKQNKKLKWIRNSATWQILITAALVATNKEYRSSKRLVLLFQALLFHVSRAINLVSERHVPLQVTWPYKWDIHIKAKYRNEYSEMIEKQKWFWKVSGKYDH